MFSILPRIDKDLHGIGLVPSLSYLTDDNMNSPLKQLVVKHIQISSNVKTHETDSFNNVDNQLPDSSGLTLRKLIMDIKAEERERFVVTMIRNSEKFHRTLGEK